MKYILFSSLRSAASQACRQTLLWAMSTERLGTEDIPKTRCASGAKFTSKQQPDENVSGEFITFP